MNSSVRRRRTRDRPGSSDLPLHADVYIGLCDLNEARMRRVVDDLQNISARLQRLHRRSEKCSVLGTVTAAVGLGAAVAAFTAQVPGGLSLAATAAAGYVAAAAAVVAFRAKQFGTEEERVKKIREFLEIVTVLQAELDNITELCEHRPEPDAAEAEDLVVLTQDVLQPLLRRSAGSGSVTELAEQCEDVFDRFRSLKRRLEEFRGRGDAERMEREEE